MPWSDRSKANCHSPAKLIFERGDIVFISNIAKGIQE